MHDRVTAEFVNVGIVVYQPDINFLQGKFVNKFSRISQFFNDINGQYLISTLKHFEKELRIISGRLDEIFTRYPSLTDITDSILPKDDSALISSELMFAIDINPQSAIEDLFSRLVDKYSHESDKETHDDKYVWRKVYKQYFDKFELTNKLIPHTVRTNHDHIEFDKAWKNGIWNCYQTLSFDLKRTDSIKGKVYKWSGILSELEKSNHELNLFLLTVQPKRNHSLNKFIRDTLMQRNGGSVKVNLIKETQAEKFVLDLKNRFPAISTVPQDHIEE
jgi:hypothetical protein